MRLIIKIQSTLIKAGILSLLVFAFTQVNAQLNPLAGIYFSNEYLGNPAMAGTDEGIALNMGYRQQWSTIPGSPKAQSLTAEYGTGKKVGLGLNVNNDEAGLIKRTRVMGTYSYHLPLNEDSRKLRFGISLGFMDDRVMSENINGDSNDPSVSKFNDRETYIDGDFGVAYTSEKLTFQAAIPNLKSVFNQDGANAGTVDRATFFSALSYRFYFPKVLDGFGVEPKLVFRGVEGHDDIIDAGAKFSVANGVASVMAVYHSSESATIGMGVKVLSLGEVHANYTTATAALSQYTSGNFQIGLKVLLQKAK